MPAFDLTLSPGVTTQVEVDDDNLLFYARHRRTVEIPDQTAVIQDAFWRPIGTGRLEELLTPDQSVVIMVDDGTRPTPAAKILPLILERIEKVGIPDEQVLVFMGLGTHRPMTETELCRKLGDEVRERYRVINRDYRDGDFVELGETESGTPIEISREIIEADFRVAVGNVMPHLSAGWGGGSKMLLPGVCSKNTRT